MSWLVWRQYRAQAAIAAVLAAFGAVLLVTGLQMASQWRSLLATCSGSAAGTCGGTPLGSALRCWLLELIGEARSPGALPYSLPSSTTTTNRCGTGRLPG